MIAAWPLTLLAWPFALAALAAVIPVVLHMIHRPQTRQMPFPTLRFLRISVQKTQRRKRVHDVLLMLIRAAVLVLVALGLARPTLSHVRLLLGGARSAVAIVLDNSASMGAIDVRQRRFDLAVSAVGQILDTLGAGDQVALLVTGGPAFPELGHLAPTQEQIRQVLPQCHVSWQGADLGARIREARRLLADCDAPNKQIYVVTDMQARSWQGLDRSAVGAMPTEAIADAGLDTPVIVIDCAKAARPNTAVYGVAIRTPVAVSGLPITIEADLWNTGEQSEQRLVELWIDDVRQETSPVLAIPPQQHVKQSLTHVFDRAGLHRGEVRLSGSDGSKFDDRRFFTLDVDPATAVAVVKARRHETAHLDESFYLERALSPGKSGRGAVAATSLTADDLRSAPLDRFKVIFAVGLPAFDAETAQRLRAYVVAGGNLVWIAGEGVDPAAYNRMNAAAHGQLLPAALVDVRTAQQAAHDAWPIGSLDAAYPVVAGLIDPPALFRSVLVSKHVRMNADKSPGAWIVARLDDGEPLLVGRNVDRGKVVMLGTAAHVDWSNLPLRPIFVPLVLRLIMALAGASSSQHQATAGAPLSVSIAGAARTIGVEIRRPSGDTVRVKTEPLQDGSKSAATTGQVLRYDDTNEIGVYTMRSLEPDRPLVTALSVNADPDESDPARIDAEELQARLAPAPTVLVDDPADLLATLDRLREGTSLLGFFLWTVLAGLVFETFLSNRFSAARGDFPPLPDSAKLSQVRTLHEESSETRS